MLPLFAATLFLSATLLFSVQPMFGKMILPPFGGAPAVWLTTLVFFQLMLLAGYAYVHATIAWLGMRKQAMLHLAILALPLALLPLRVRTAAFSSLHPLASVWVVLVSSIGLPFFAVSASAPLLQRWFGSSLHSSSRDPYFLYAASNLGSLGALLAYPLAVEPLFRVTTQSQLWSAAYVLLIALTIACAVVVRRCWTSVDATAPADADGDLAGPVTWSTRLRWVALAAVPSSLLLSVTSNITTDFAVPLLWVAPLAIYLLTFVLVFARRSIISPRLMTTCLPFVVAAPLVLVAGRVEPSFVFIPIHLLTLFVAAMACHGELASTRPAVSRLTEFYLWLSIGGATGGLFNVLVAPLLFRTSAEYPLGLVLACLVVSLRSRHEPKGTPSQAGRATAAARQRRFDFIIPVVLAAIVVILEFAAARLRFPIGSAQFIGCVFAVPIVVALRFRERPIRFSLGLAAIFVAAALYPEWSQEVIASDRSFYGVHQVANRGAYRVLIHGTTNHGAQSLRPARICVPLSYYYPTGPLGELFTGFEHMHANANIGVIGLGTGSTAGYAKVGQQWTFYEIDPAIERLARDPRYFTFLRDCAPQARVVLGDARLSLARRPDAVHDLMIFDAFNSDAVPVHLLTREAMQLYLRKLAPHGVMAFHISNRYFDLRPVLSRLARDARLVASLRDDDSRTPAEQAEGKEPSIWIVMARQRGELGNLTSDDRWMPSLPTIRGAAWTDDYSNVLSTLIARQDNRF